MTNTAQSSGDYTTMPLAEIVVENRRRVQMGSLSGLMKSIGAYGLLNPITVSDQYLVCGGRRLEAMRKLGFAVVPVHQLGPLDEAARQAIEFSENEDRKDLTPAEKARRLLTKAEEAAQLLAEAKEREQQEQTAGSDLLGNGFPKSRGRPPAQVTEQDKADALGVTRRTLNTAQRTVEAVKQYPVLEQAATQADVLEAAAMLDALPAETRADVLAVVEAPRAPAPAPVPATAPAPVEQAEPTAVEEPKGKPKTKAQAKPKAFAPTIREIAEKVAAGDVSGPAQSGDEVVLRNAPDVARELADSYFVREWRDAVVRPAIRVLQKANGTDLERLVEVLKDDADMRSLEMTVRDLAMWVTRFWEMRRDTRSRLRIVEGG